MTFRPAAPCERCGRRDRCTVSVDGGTAICRTPEVWTDDDRVRHDRGGGEYIVLRGTGPSGDGVDPDALDIAPAETLDAVYTALRDLQRRDHPMLDAHDEAGLRRRGFSEGDIARLGYWSLASGATDRTLTLFTLFGSSVLRVPGIFERRMVKGVHVGGASGLAIPVRDVAGRIVRLRIRYEEPSADGKPRRVYAWLSTPRSPEVTGVPASAAVHVPLHDPAMRTGEVWVSEGELKSDLATLKLGRLCISIPGVGMWDRALPVLRDLGAERVVLAFDGDARTNPGVAGALQRFAGALAEEGFTVAVATWPEAHKGIDDAVVALGPEAITVHEGLDAVARIRELVASSGAHADPADDAEALVRAAVAKAKEVIRAPYEPDVLAAVTVLRRERPASWIEIKETARRQSAPRLREWESAIRAAEMKALRERREAEEGPRRERPRIRVTDDEEGVANQVLEIIAANEPNLYARNGVLTRVVVERVQATTFVRIEPIPRDALREIISRHVQFFRHKEKSDGDIVTVIEHPPPWCVTALHSRGDWPGVRPILSVADAPVLTPSGVILDSPGYDDATGCLYAPTREFDRAPANPTPEEGAAALAQLADVVSEFLFSTTGPHEDPEENRRMHLAGALALPLTLVARPMIAGPVPAFAIDAPDSSAGKTNLAETLVALATGNKPLVKQWNLNEEEWAKAHLATLLGGARALLYDNVATGGVFGHAALDAALTAWPCWSGRILGQTREVSTRNDLVVIATGNNPRIPNDTIRRLVRVRLDKREEEFFDEKGRRKQREWKYCLPDAAPRLATKMATLAATAIRAWVLAGKPKADLLEWGSYSAWADVIPQVLAWYGYPDIRRTQDMLREEDQGSESLDIFLRGWAALGGADGMSPSEVLNLMSRQDMPAEAHTALGMIREGLEGLDTRRRASEHNPHTLGRLIAKFRGKVVRGRSIVQATHRGDRTRWVIRGGVPAPATAAAAAAAAAGGGDDDGYLH